MALASDIINIDTFDANALTSGQWTSKARVENRVQKIAAHFLYSISFSSQEAFQNPKKPSNNVFTGHATTNLWEYHPTFGHYPWNSALAQLSYYELLYASISRPAYIINFCHIFS